MERSYPESSQKSLRSLPKRWLRYNRLYIAFWVLTLHPPTRMGDLVTYWGVKPRNSIWNGVWLRSIFNDCTSNSAPFGRHWIFVKSPKSVFWRNYTLSRSVGTWNPILHPYTPLWGKFCKKSPFSTVAPIFWLHVICRSSSITLERPSLSENVF